ncbi:putative flavin-containing monooxygenase YUCCA3 [Aureobasidium subglaciale]|nr:putative flavin-containing monooxygenase YUCCA3 [Aureobasidium subglaciale]
MVALVGHPHTIELPRLSNTAQKTQLVEATDPLIVVREWLQKFESFCHAGAVSNLGQLVHEQAWWRDHLTLTWDLRTLKGLSKIQKVLEGRLSAIGLGGFTHSKEHFTPKHLSPLDGLDWNESMFEFSTASGAGKGMVRLVFSDGHWKAHMIYTCLLSLKDAPEAVGDLRPHGGNNSLKGGVVQGNWYEERQRQISFLDVQPDVLILGAGQAGLNLGARLQALGMSCLLVDKNERVGDNWRNRYRTLVMHDPVHYSHFSYMPFPANWPMFTPKDKLADWFEAYASSMELNIWMQSTVQLAEYDEAAQTWKAEIKRADGSVVTLTPKHVVVCTGQSGEPRIPVFPGQSTFKGTTYHASQHKDATLFGGHMSDKKVIVVGTGNSGHDIAQNFCENGTASVTMIQRRGTYVITAKKGLFMLHTGLYEEHGPPTEDADIYGQSLPIPVQFALNVGGTEKITAAEKDTLDGLVEAGFKLDFGEDQSGIYRKYITRGGGYYIDVGASQLIIDGKIKIQQSPGGIKCFEDNSVILADGTKLDADIVVLATGFDNMRTTIRKILGDKIADKCKDVWDLDEEGEVNAMWRPSGHPRFWYMGGSLALCRTYSRLLALQIKAMELGLNKEGLGEREESS